MYYVKFCYHVLASFNISILCIQIEMPGDRGSSRPGKAANMFTIKIVFVAMIDVSELQLFLEKKGPFTSSCTTAIQALNVVLTHKPFANMVNSKSSVFESSYERFQVF